MEFPEEKRPTDKMIWDGTPEEIDDWIKRVFSNKESPVLDFVINEDEIE